MRIAFAGNPNSGKTTMYNLLTGENERVGNWGGVTVGKKEAPFAETYTKGKDVTAVDLPGAYSMSPFTPEEGITSEFVRSSRRSCWSWVFRLLSRSTRAISTKRKERRSISQHWNRNWAVRSSRQYQQKRPTTDSMRS